MKLEAMGESFYFYNDPSISRFFKNPLKIFKKGLDPVNMMQTVVNLMRTMKAFGYDVEEELFKDRKKFKHKIKGYRSLDDFDDLDDLINMLGISEERFGNPSAIMNLNVTAESRSDIINEYLSPSGESDVDDVPKNDSVIDKVSFEVGVPVNNETVSEEASGKSDSRDESDRRRRSANEREDSAGRDIIGDTKSLIAAKLLRDPSDIVLSFHRDFVLKHEMSCNMFIRTLLEIFEAL